MTDPKFFREKDVKEIIKRGIESGVKEAMKDFKAGQSKGLQTVGMVMNDFMVFIAKVLAMVDYNPAFEVFVKEMKHEYTKETMSEILQKLKEFKGIK